MDQNSGRPPTDEVAQSEGERLVYALPADAMWENNNEDISLLELWNILWKGKWLIAAITSASAVVAVIYVLTATEWYRAEVLLAPAAENPASGLTSQLGSLGGLASLAGVGSGSDGNIEAIAILSSRNFTRAFIEDEELLPVLFSDEWDAENGRWSSEDPEDRPDMRDAVRYFDRNLRKVSEDRVTKLITLSVHWTDPETAAEWANSLVSRLNEHMRGRALREAEANRAYLEEQLSTTNIATLRLSIGRLLETELQKLMLARGNEEFAFRVIDSAETPKYREKPKRKLMVILGTLFGGFVSVLFVFVRHAVRNIKSTN